MKLLFLGDYCNSESTMPKLAPAARDLFQSANLISVNFEAPIVSIAQRPVAKAGPTIGQPASVLRSCQDLGITHYSLANNHIMDYGRDGLHSTIDHLDGLTYFGAGMCFEQAYQPGWFEASGMRIGLLSFAEAQFGVLQDEYSGDQAGYAWIDHPRARQSIRDARVKADWLIVQVHAGLEMVDLPLPEWRQRYRELIDLGADLVIGHHPHVVQGSECYKGKMIHYSLGNFYMDVMLRQSDPGSGAALQVIIDGKGLHSEVILLKVSQAEIDLDQSQESHTHYQSLCERLNNDESYFAEIQQICIDFWETIYSHYYESALLGFGTQPSFVAVWRVFRRMAGYVLKGKMNCRANELMLIHNIRIETHRWVVERALANRDRQ